MISYIRQYLGLKLFLTYLLVILVSVVVVAITAQFALPSAFNRHMAGMGMIVDDERLLSGPGLGLGRGQAEEQGGEMMHSLFENFRAGFNQALALAVLVAIAFAILVSLFVSRGVVAPLQAMMAASQRIAAGQYGERVRVRSIDELGQLAVRFNQMASQLEAAEAMRRQLIGDVAHELRTPLTTIKGSAEGLVDGVLPASAETFQQIEQESERLNRLVDDLQELSRVEAGAYALDFKPVAIVKIIETARRRLQRLYAEKDVSLIIDVPADLPAVHADEDRIGQVLINLMGNALQYTPGGGNVHISAMRNGEEISICVRDTGIGIPSEHLPYIFDRFYRIDKSRSRKLGGGSGIGLTIAKHLVEAHGGRIWAESEGAGKGSTFTFTLRLAH